MKNLFLSIFLCLLAIILFFVLLIPGILWQVKEVIRERKNENFVSNWLYRFALVIDQAGNVLYSEMFNDLLITNKGYKFGNRKETISSVIGKNKRSGDLLFLGKKLDYLLDKIEKHHSILAIDEKV